MAIVSDLLQLCRLCLVKDEVNVPIFEGESDDQQISLKISSCLPVTLSQDDRLPQKICSECCRKLDTLYEFRNSSVNAEKQLVTWLEELEDQSKKTSEKMSIATESLSEKTIVKEEIDEVDENGALSNEADEYILQQQVAYDKTDLLNDAADETGEPQPKRAKRAAALKALIHTQESEEDEEDIDEPEPITKAEEESEPSETDINESVDDTFAGGPSTSADDQPGPSGVGKSTEGPIRILAELPTKNVSTFSCEVCGKIFDNSRKSLSHKRMHLEKRFQCPHCDKAYKYDYMLKLHLKTSHSTGNEVCEVCGKLFKTKDNLNIHMMIHKRSYKYNCLQCGKGYFKQNLLRDHIDVQHKGIHFTCDKCKKTFKWGITYKNHLKTHLPDHVKKEYICPVCGKLLKHPKSFKHHKKLHSEEENLDKVCEICGLTVRYLASHLKMHSGEKPCVCDICGKSFIRQAHLIIHKRIHTKEKPYSCEMCTKSFSQKSALTIHIRYHTGYRPYKCDRCLKGFVTLNFLKKHVCKGLDFENN